MWPMIKRIGLVVALMSIISGYTLLAVHHRATGERVLASSPMLAQSGENYWEDGADDNIAPDSAITELESEASALHRIADNSPIVVIEDDVTPPSYDEPIVDHRMSASATPPPQEPSNRAITIRYSDISPEDEPPETPSQSVVSADSQGPPTEPATSAIRSDSIHFDFESATLTNAAQAILSDIASTMRQNSSVMATIVGYTDDEESSSGTPPLDMQRAATARDFLVTTERISTSRISVTRGGVAPASTGDAPVDNLLNRRIEIQLVLSEERRLRSLSGPRRWR